MKVIKIHVIMLATHVPSFKVRIDENAKKLTRVRTRVQIRGFQKFRFQVPENDTLVQVHVRVQK